MRADGGGFADDHTGAVVDEEMRTDVGAGMDVDARALVPEFREHARQQRHLEGVEDVGEALERDGQDAGVGEDDLIRAPRGGIARVGGSHVGLHESPNLGQGGQKLHGGLFRVGLRVGVAGVAEAFLHLAGQAGLDLFQQPVEPGGRLGLGEPAVLKEPREQQVHEVAGQFIDQVLRGQVGPVEVVDPATQGVGFKEGLLDGFGGHGVEGADSFVKNPRRSNALGGNLVIGETTPF